MDFYQEIRTTTCLVTHLIQFLVEKKVKNVTGYRIVFSIEPDADKIYLSDPTVRLKETTALMTCKIKFLWVNIFLRSAKT